MKAHRNSHTTEDGSSSLPISTVPEMALWAVDFLASTAKKRHAIVKFTQRIPPRWYRLEHGGFWHIGALSRNSIMRARKSGWKANILSVFYATKEVAGNNHAGEGNNQELPTPDSLQASLWGDVGR